MIPAFINQDRLPIGRFQCDLAAVESALVHDARFDSSQARKSLWIEFSAALSKFHGIRCKIPAVFLSGSFVTAKIDPDDVDVVFLIDFSTLHSPATFAALGKLVQMLNSTTKIHAFVIPWYPSGPTTPAQMRVDYFYERGRWDDFWQRDVAKPDRVPFVRDHAFPRRGYLEVLIDGYH